MQEYVMTDRNAKSTYKYVVARWKDDRNIDV